ncbi:hypothetical protein [Amycolatopsis sp. H20-H5]|nr:hypothetical protein [Amycolatopsis sp. H20-H5]MEC3976880.1 hypothetical protein [Amycolatopsis sp. H20-H5]
MAEICKLLAATDDEAISASGVLGLDFPESIASSLVVANTNEG